MVKNRCLLLTEEEFSMQLPLLKLGTFWFASFLSLEFIFNIHSNKTSLAIAYSVFQELSTAHRDNRPIQEFYTIMRTIDWHRLPPFEGVFVPFRRPIVWALLRKSDIEKAHASLFRVLDNEGLHNQEGLAIRFDGGRGARQSVLY